jgi:phospholipid/cholesterol/gamma-HCH transport system substrate-binding protein
MARLESQGVTGVAYIALSGGSPGAARLTQQPEGLSIIPSSRSSFQSLVNSAPDLIEDAARIINQLEQITGPENQAHLRNILENVDSATEGLELALADFSDISATLSGATDQVTGFVEGFEGVGDATKSTLSSADTSFATITETFENANAAIDQANTAIASINTLIADDFTPLADDLRTTLNHADAALVSADQAFARADVLMATDIGPALADARAALGQLNETLTKITADVPAIMTDLRSGVAEARQAIAAAAPGMRDFGQLGGEARAAVRAFNDLIRRLAQDPSGFLLDNRVPEYRR